MRGPGKATTYERSLPVLERLALHSGPQVTERSAEIGDCVVWLRSCNQAGYGQIWMLDPLKRWLVHRAAWVAANGEIPEATPLVLHHCDNPPCWKIEHLFLGTVQDNVRDRHTKGRSRNGSHNATKTHCIRGHPFDEKNTYVRLGKRQCRACALFRYHERKLHNE